MTTSTTFRFGAVTLALSVLLAAAIRLEIGVLDAVQSWLLATTVVTFLTYGYDKAIAGSKWTRVPEKVLLLLAFVGGTIGALMGMRLFHHKTAKGSFRLRFWLVVAAQIVLLVAYYVWLRPLL